MISHTLCQPVLPRVCTKAKPQVNPVISSVCSRVPRVQMLGLLQKSKRFRQFFLLLISKLLVKENHYLQATAEMKTL